MHYNPIDDDDDFDTSGNLAKRRNGLFSLLEHRLCNAFSQYSKAS